MGDEMQENSASNEVYGGMEVKAYANPNDLMFGKHDGYLSPAAVPVAAAYFQAKRDEELGRWRWPEDPDYVVYRDRTPAGQPTDGTVVVIHEPSGDRMWADPDGGRSSDGAHADRMPDAAAAYFAAFPFTRKPWHDAKPGEVWVITTRNVADERAVQVTPNGTFQYNDAIEFPHDFRLTYEAIESGRRIWPEDAS